MLKQRRALRLTVGSPVVMLFPCFLLASDMSLKSGERGGQEGAEEMPGALDPSIPEVLMTQPPVNETRALAATVATNVLVNSRDLCTSGRGNIQNETSITADGNNILVAYNDSRGICNPSVYGAMGFSYSLDGGATFIQGINLPHSADMNNGDPWLGVSPPDATGQRTFYMSGLYRGYSGFGFFHGTFTDTGIQWAATDPTVISFPSSGAIMDKEAFAVDQTNGYIYLTYTDFRTGTPIRSTRSTDGGYTWDDPVQVSSGGSQGSFPAIDSNGTVFVAYQQSGTIRVSRSVDQGASFQQVASFPFSNPGVQFMDRSSDFPQVGIDTTNGDRRGWIYVVWHSSVGGVLRPMIAHSEDGGDNWIAPIPVNTDDVNAPHWWPSVSVDISGGVNVIFLDRRLNPGTGITNTFFARSVDGASTFTETVASDSSGNWQTIAHDSGFTWSGDYIRAISTTQAAAGPVLVPVILATWADARNGDPDVYFARITP